VQNEAKLGGTRVCGQRQLSCGPWLGRGARDCGLEIADCGLRDAGCGRAPEAKCAKRSQFPAGPGGTRPQGRGPIMQNKMPTTKVEFKPAKPRYQPRNADRKPLPRLLSWASNKPNLGDRRKKWGGDAQPPITSGAGSTRSRSVQNKPNLAGRPDPGVRNARNEANLWAGGPGLRIEVAALRSQRHYCGLRIERRRAGTTDGDAHAGCSQSQRRIV
jgi:hypothetical protein